MTKDIFYIGVNDRSLDLFEGQYIVPEGMAYNSYLILDEKIAVMDTVSENFGEEWLGNIKKILGDRTPDYLVIQHMEPDHSANILSFLKAYPKTKIVSSAKSFGMMKQFYGEDFSETALKVGDGDSLSLGEHTLSFVTAPMVHWPEVMMSYEEKEQTLFSADAFGKFGALDADEDWACEARRYYFGIVGKYGTQVQAVLKKLSDKNIACICPLHGPILRENLGYYLNLYHTWSSYEAESQGVLIAYTSIYGNTEKAVLLLKDALEKKGCAKVVLQDLARTDMAEAVEDAFRYSHLVLATTTYNGDIFPYMRHFIDALTERDYQNRSVAFIENGTWAPVAARIMRGALEKSKNLHFAQQSVKLLSAVNEESFAQIQALAEEICQDFKKA